MYAFSKENEFSITVWVTLFNREIINMGNKKASKSGNEIILLFPLTFIFAPAEPITDLTRAITKQGHLIWLEVSDWNTSLTQSYELWSFCLAKSINMFTILVKK